MILPYQFRDSLITSYVGIPLDAYFETLYRAKTWSVDVNVTVTYPSSTYDYSITGIYDRQFFAGPENVWTSEFVQDAGFEAAWASKQMTAATRRVVYDTDSSGSPLKYQDPQSYLTPDVYDGKQVVSGYMAWVGLLSGSTVVTPDGGSPETFSFTNSKQAFALPCFGDPLLWGVIPADTTIVSGIIKAATLTGPWKIHILGDYGCTDPSASGFFGSMESLTNQLGPAVTATLVDASGSSRTIVNAGQARTYSADSVSGSVTLTAASVW